MDFCSDQELPLNTCSLLWMVFIDSMPVFWAYNGEEQWAWHLIQLLSSRVSHHHHWGIWVRGAMFQKHGKFCFLLALAMTTECEEAAKNEEEKNQTFYEMRFVTFSTFLYIQYILSQPGFTSYMLLCTEWARISWPGLNETGFAMTRVSTGCVNKNKSPLKAIDIKKIMPYWIFYQKETSAFYRSCCLLYERTTCGKQIKNSALSYVDVRLPWHISVWMQQKSIFRFCSIQLVFI